MSNDDRNNFKILLSFQLLLAGLKASDLIALPWSAVLIPSEALLAVPVLSASAYFLSVFIHAVICIFRTIGEKVNQENRKQG